MQRQLMILILVLAVGLRGSLAALCDESLIPDIPGLPNHSNFAFFRTPRLMLREKPARHELLSRSMSCQCQRHGVAGRPDLVFTCSAGPAGIAFEFLLPR